MSSSSPNSKWMGRDGKLAESIAGRSWAAGHGHFFAEEESPMTTANASQPSASSPAGTWKWTAQSAEPVISIDFRGCSAKGDVSPRHRHKEAPHSSRNPPGRGWRWAPASEGGAVAPEGFHQCGESSGDEWSHQRVKAYAADARRLMSGTAKQIPAVSSVALSLAPASHPGHADTTKQIPVASSTASTLAPSSSPSHANGPATVTQRDPRISSVQLRGWFDLCDPNLDGTINKREIIKLCRSNPEVAAQLGFPDHVAQEDGSRDIFEARFQALDANCDREISWDEFQEFFAPELIGAVSAMGMASHSSKVPAEQQASAALELAALPAPASNSSGGPFATASANTSPESPVLARLKMLAAEVEEVDSASIAQHADSGAAAGQIAPTDTKLKSISQQLNALVEELAG
eukprot:CAMPEP_0197699762 /NCGR_PEP_ID=MMETSP1338-20131121/121041_1 /TAXON_ID=43686 ORGANISM="Pelagodinium beii, Strain RCC1491" /NCGR_SAMPLE_ID=MMETSP1338 /ASSEMBLY_ACC=CAM_ASM_000754 /LENGTH=404 /DNA_ID=CAMNT_0043283287 /DNA_START=41 /DNA_END=1251 /DNA_ORIENTATION=-